MAARQGVVWAQVFMLYFYLVKKVSFRSEFETLFHGNQGPHLKLLASHTVKKKGEYILSCIIILDNLSILVPVRILGQGKNCATPSRLGQPLLSDNCGQAILYGCAQIIPLIDSLPK